MYRKNLSRRNLLKTGIATTAVGVCKSAVATPVSAGDNKIVSIDSEVSIAAAETGQRKLEFYSLHTLEKLRFAVCDNGPCDENVTGTINHFFRDHRSDEVTAMDIRLFQILDRVQKVLGMPMEFQVISGYRSLATNEMLRRQSKRVASRSYHMFGRAIDLRVDNVPTTDLRDAAIEVGDGGVGYYTRSDFIHIDTGPVRVW